MDTNRIEIYGTIDRYGFGSNYFKWQLRNFTGKPVTVLVNSYGGDVNEALSICNQIAEHGDVTVEYVAYNASAATLLGLYAKKAVINSDALFMIHKTSVWIDTWGQMNEDQIDSVIEDLKAKKDLASVSTLQLAKAYSSKSGKTVAEILIMMKEAKWMTPEEVLKAGFVDEILQSKTRRQKLPEAVAAMFESQGISLPELDDEQGKNKDILKEIKDIINQGFSSLKKNNTNPKLFFVMNKEFTEVNRILNVEGFDIKQDSVTLTSQQLKALNDELMISSNNKKLLDEIAGKLDKLDSSVMEKDSLSEKIDIVGNLLENKLNDKPCNLTGKDNHHSELTYTPDPVNDFFNE